MQIINRPRVFSTGLSTVSGWSDSKTQMDAPPLASPDEIKIPSIFFTVFVLAVVVKLTFHAWKSNHNEATEEDLIRPGESDSDEQVHGAMTDDDVDEDTVPMSRPRAALSESSRSSPAPSRGPSPSSASESEPVMVQSQPPTPTHVFNRSSWVFDHAQDIEPRQRVRYETSESSPEPQEPPRPARPPLPPRGSSPVGVTASIPSNDRISVSVEDRYRQTQGNF